MEKAIKIQKEEEKHLLMIKNKMAWVQVITIKTLLPIMANHLR